ncbi:MAG: site-specific integrase [Verrucomicrobiota bacterium]
MSEKNESRFSRVAEGIYRYKSGGFYLRCRLAGKPVWHKLKNSNLQSARREARDIIRSGFKVQRKQAARTVGDFSQEELDRYSNAAEKTLKKVEGYHAKVVDHWPGGVAMPISSAGKQDVEKCINDAVGTCGASYRNQFVQYLRRVFDRALAAKAIGSVPGADPGMKKKETVWKLATVMPATSLIPTVEQWRSVVETIRNRKLSDTRDEAADVVEAFALLGLGQAEVASLQWQHVNLEQATLSVKRRKTGVPFTVPLNSAAVELLKRRKDVTGASPTGYIFTVYSPKKAIEAACTDLGYPAFTPRSFRKLYITEALRAGVNVKIIAEMQGHRDGGKLILKTYSAEVNAEELARAGTKMSAVFGTPAPSAR